MSEASDENVEVHKFGGTSVSSLTTLVDLVKGLKSGPCTHLIVVVSAFTRLVCVCVCVLGGFNSTKSMGWENAALLIE